MDKKIFLPELADVIAAREGFSKRKAEMFCRLFFETVEEGLKKDKYVKIKGFGTFKLVPVGERESVNVNTGERIHIGGHSKISFTPDALLRDLVNKPFAHFQTVTINEETDIEELESVPTPEIVGAVEEEEEQLENVETEATEVSEETEIPETPSSEPEADQSEMPQEEVVENIIEVVEETPEVEAPAPVVEPEEDDEVTQEDIVAVEEPVETPAAEAQKEAEEASVNQGYTIEVADEKPVDVEDEKIEPEVEETEAVEEELADEVEDEEPVSRCGIWRWLGAILLIAALMVMSYLAGYYRVFCCDADRDCETPSKSEVKAKPDAATPKDTTALKKADEDEQKTEAEADGQKVTPAEENVDSQVPAPKTSEERVHIVKPGESLYSIAKEYYGDKMYAFFIIQNNDFEDPNIIRVGMTVKLPPLPEGEQP